MNTTTFSRRHSEPVCEIEEMRRKCSSMLVRRLESAGVGSPKPAAPEIFDGFFGAKVTSRTRAFSCHGEAHHHSSETAERTDVFDVPFLDAPSVLLCTKTRCHDQSSQDCTSNVHSGHSVDSTHSKASASRTQFEATDQVNCNNLALLKANGHTVPGLLFLDVISTESFDPLQLKPVPTGDGPFSLIPTLGARNVGEDACRVLAFHADCEQQNRYENTRTRSLVPLPGRQ